MTTRIEDVEMGNNVFIGENVVIRNGCHIGSDVVIGHNTVIEEDVIIGAGTRIQAMCYITKGMRIGRKVFIGPCFQSTNDKKIMSHGRGDFVNQAPIIKDFARIGGGVMLLPGVTIDVNGFVGAGSVVTKCVGIGEVWYGSGEAKFRGVIPDEEFLR
jgi:acetyltransferase-like isoleucine patch superfamily enzyme